MTSPRWHLVVGLFCALLGVPVLAAIEVFFADGDKSISAAEAVYEYARRQDGFSAGQLSTLSAGVRHAHAGHWGPSGRELLQLLWPFAMIALAIVHLHRAATAATRAR
jgi:hypothetical protein